MYRIEINNRRFLVNGQELDKIRARGVAYSFIIQGV